MSSEKPTIVVCWTTVGDQQAADDLAKQLIAESLAACVQVDGPVTSHFCWEGRQCAEQEYRLSIKTSPEMAERLMKKLQQIHPYDQPQIVMLESCLVDPGYQQWVSDSVGRCDH